MQQATLHVFRRKALPGMAAAFRVEVDGNTVGRVGNGEQITVAVPAGSHAVQIRGAMGSHSPMIVADFVEGGRLDFTCRMTGSFSLKNIDLRQENGHAPARPAPPPGPPEGRVLEIVETDRVTETLPGDDVRTIDNRDGSADVTRVIRASRDWTRSLTIDAERSRSRGRGLTAGPQWLSLRQNAETALRQSYSIGAEMRETYAEEISLLVPAGTCVELVLHWKRILQRGIVRVESGHNGIVELPFQMVAAVTFDQTQRRVA
jgi:hypothetical protein